MKDILVHVDDSRAGAARVHSAIEVAKAFGANLIGLHVEPDVDISPGVPLAQVDTLVHYAEDVLAAESRRSRSIFLASAQAAGLAHDYWRSSGDVPRHIAAAARYADLVIVGQYEHQGSAVRHPLPICHAVGLHCGRPVLVLPAADEKIALPSRVIIAWDGSREAVRAVHDALPFLTVAREVHVVVAEPKAERLPDDVQKPQRLSHHLARHGVEVSSWDRIGKGETVAEAIDEYIGRHRFDLLVMGAYTHPEWYEFLVGGVTKSLLLSSSIPMLISH